MMPALIAEKRGHVALFVDGKQVALQNVSWVAAAYGMQSRQ